MKTLVIGAGSMGRRRLRDLLALNVGEVLLYEPQGDRCREVSSGFGVRGFTDLSEALAQGPEALVVSVPPALHDAYVQQAVERRLHVFAEVPFVFDLKALESVAERAGASPSVLGVSHTIRYYPPYRIIRDLIRAGRVGRPLYLEYSLGNYLPDWRPYEDYRKFYASDASLGGAGMDMVLHELDAIQWWLGRVDAVCARLNKISNLEIRGPDGCDVLLSFEGGARGYFHHDLFEQGTVGRHIRIAGEGGTVEWHQNQPEIRLFDGASRKTLHIPFREAADWPEAIEASRLMRDILERTALRSGGKIAVTDEGYTYEANYLREMRHFCDAAQGRRPFTMSTVAEELQTVRVLHAILRSAEQGREVAVNSVKGER